MNFTVEQEMNTAHTSKKDRNSNWHASKSDLVQKKNDRKSEKKIVNMKKIITIVLSFVIVFLLKFYVAASFTTGFTVTAKCFQK